MVTVAQQLDYVTLLNCILKNSLDGKFYVMCILPQLKIKKIKIKTIDILLAKDNVP